MPRKKISKRIGQLLLAFLSLLLISTGIDGTSIQGIWVVRSTLQSKQSILEMVEKAAEAGLDQLFVQVNMSGYAYYKSERLPLAVSGFDPLAYLLEEAHKRGLKVHAWVNAFTVGALGLRPTNPKHVLYQHPDWALVDVDGVSVLEYSKGTASEALPALYLEPGLKEVQDWVVENYLEVVRNYAVDGIHFDFIRYPGRSFGYHPQVGQLFFEQFGFWPKDLIKDWSSLKAKLGRDGYLEASGWFDDYRRKSITSIVHRVYQKTKEFRPTCIVSAAVFPQYADACEQKFQDWFSWLNEGYLDWALPMVYDPEDYILDLRLSDLARRVDKKKVAIGLGPYQDSCEGTLNKIAKVKKAEFLGYVLFSYDAIKNSELWLLINKE